MSTRLIRGPRPLWLLAALATLLLTGACSEVRSAIGLDESTPTPATTTTPTATPVVAHYIGNTGGLGVSLRSDCLTDARIDGAWAETTEVHILEVGSGRCQGWQLARVGGVTSWVANNYLVGTPPNTVAAPPAAAATTQLSAPRSPAATAAATVQPTATTEPTATPTSTTATGAPLPPMSLYGPAELGASILILIDGQPCKTITPIPEPASPTGYLWSTLLGSGECNAQNGSAITFTLNGAPTNQQLEWFAGGTPANPVTGITLTIR